MGRIAGPGLQEGVARVPPTRREVRHARALPGAVALGETFKEPGMHVTALAALRTSAIDLNQPGTYLHWSIFTVSVANLMLIAVMVVIFGAALLLPFPKGNPEGDLAQEAPPQEGPQEPIGGQTIP